MRPPLRDVIGPILGSIAFFAIAPGMVAFWVPWRITRWELAPPLLGLAALRPAGVVLALLGLAGLVESFGRFAIHGRGTPAPVMPPTRLVVTGLYRYVRNPMYVAVLSIVVGQAVFFGSPRLLAYAVLVWATVHFWVLLYEEPNLRARFGADYAAYRAAVRRWWPRLRPWRG